MSVEDWERAEGFTAQFAAQHAVCVSDVINKEGICDKNIIYVTSQPLSDQQQHKMAAPGGSRFRSIKCTSFCVYKS